MIEGRGCREGQRGERREGQKGAAGRTEGGWAGIGGGGVASPIPLRFTLSLPGLGFLTARRFAVRVARVCVSDLAVMTVFADVGMIEESAGRGEGEVIR